MKMYKSELFPYIEGGQLVGKGDVVLTIRRVEAEMMPGHGGSSERKYVLYFQETGKGLILNKTNTKSIIDVVAQVKPDLTDPDETDDWTGVKIALYTEKVKAFGEVHDAVRIRDKAPKQKKGAASKKEQDKAVADANAALFGEDMNGAPIGNNYQQEEA